MTSRKNINMFDFNGVNVAKHWNVAGEVFAISDCLVMFVILLDYLTMLILRVTKNPKLTAGLICPPLTLHIAHTIVPTLSPNDRDIRVTYK